MCHELALELVSGADFYRVRKHFSSPIDLWGFRGPTKIRKIRVQKLPAPVSVQKLPRAVLDVFWPVQFKKKIQYLGRKTRQNLEKGSHHSPSTSVRCKAKHLQSKHNNHDTCRVGGQSETVQSKHTVTIEIWFETSSKYRVSDFCRKSKMAMKWPSVKPFGLIFGAKWPARRARSI